MRKLVEKEKNADYVDRKTLLHCHFFKHFSINKYGEIISILTFFFVIVMLTEIN